MSFQCMETALKPQLNHGVGRWREMRLEGGKGSVCVGHGEEFRFYLKCAASL